MINASRKLIWILLIIAIVIAAVFIAFRITESFWGFLDKSEELEYIDNLSLSIETRDADIILSFYSGDNLVINQTNRKRFNIDQNKESINIKQTSKLGGGNIEILIPSQKKLNSLTLKSLSGDIEVNKIESENIIIECTSGDIFLRSILSPTLKVKLLSGSLEAQNIVSDNLFNINSTSGNIDLTSSNLKSANLQSISGEVSILSSTFDSLDISTVSGEAELYLSNTPTLNIESVVSGTLDYFGDIMALKKMRLEGDDSIINYKTTSGNFTLRHI